MGRISARLVGVELYFDDMDQAKTFYGETLGLEVSDEERGHYAKFDGGGSFVCLERKGSESYPSRDKAVLFFEVPDLTGDNDHRSASIRTRGIAVGGAPRSRRP
jgi:predicted enzyme related to lactoylglutathione lyase